MRSASPCHAGLFSEERVCAAVREAAAWPLHRPDRTRRDARTHRACRHRHGNAMREASGPEPPGGKGGRVVTGSPAAGCDRRDRERGRERRCSRSDSRGRLPARGLRVQPFKVGPDFLDPTYLTLAAGRTCYNLDGWMTGRDYVNGPVRAEDGRRGRRGRRGRDGPVRRGGWAGLAGSTAEIAAWLGAPVILVADAHGAARSFAATVSGFAGFEPSIRIAGVIANRSGSGGTRSGPCGVVARRRTAAARRGRPARRRCRNCGAGTSVW